MQKKKQKHTCIIVQIIWPSHSSAHFWPFWMSLKASFKCLYTQLNEKLTLWWWPPIKQRQEKEQKYKMFPKVSGLLKVKVFWVECKSVGVTHVGNMTIKCSCVGRLQRCLSKDSSCACVHQKTVNPSVCAQNLCELQAGSTLAWTYLHVPLHVPHLHVCTIVVFIRAF